MKRQYLGLKHQKPMHSCRPQKVPLKKTTETIMVSLKMANIILLLHLAIENTIWHLCMCVDTCIMCFFKHLNLLK